MKGLRNLFNAAAVVTGAAVFAGASAAFLSGFLGCGDNAIGACINPAALLHTPVGFVATAAVASLGASLYSFGRSRQKAAAPKP
jgi:hypothetical protein